MKVVNFFLTKPMTKKESDERGVTTYDSTNIAEKGTHGNQHISI